MTSRSSTSSVSRLLALVGCVAALALAFAEVSGCAVAAGGGNPLDEGSGGDASGAMTGGEASGGSKPFASASSAVAGTGGAPATPGGGTAVASSGNAGAGASSAGSTGPSAASSSNASSASSAAGSSASAGSSSSTGSGMQPPGDVFDQFQHHNLDVVNQYRATLGRPPLVLDEQISAFALAGSKELSIDHTPHKHFNDAGSNGTIWQNGFKMTAGENQGDPNGWFPLAPDPTQNELAQIDAIQKAMYDEGPGQGQAHGHYENMMSTKFTRLGVGLLEINGKLYLTNDFSD